MKRKSLKANRFGKSFLGNKMETKKSKKICDNNVKEKYTHEIIQTKKENRNACF